MKFSFLEYCVKYASKTIFGTRRFMYDQRSDSFFNNIRLYIDTEPMLICLSF